MKLIFNIENDHLTLIDEAGQSKIPLFSIDPADLSCELPPKQLIDSFLNNITKYDAVLKYTYGLTAILDIIAISSLLFRTLSRAKYKIRALEIGSRFGCATVFIALGLKAFSEDNILFCMDTWKGTENGGDAHEIANYINALEHFRSVMHFMGVSEQVKPIICDSALGMEALRDNYYDIIFIDAAHNYKNILADILNAIRIVRPGGLIMGHGCTCKMSQLPDDIKNSMASMDDPISFGGYSVGVAKALHDTFGDDYEHFAPSLVWYKTISTEDKKRLISLELFVKEKKIVDMSYSVMEAIAAMNHDSLRRKDLRLLYDALRFIDCISAYLNNNFHNLKNREVKSATMLLKNYIVHVLNAIQNPCPGVAEKYFKKAVSLQTEWYIKMRQEFDC